MHQRERKKLAAHFVQAETSHGAPAQGSLFNLGNKPSAPARLPVYRYALHLTGFRRKREHISMLCFVHFFPWAGTGSVGKRDCRLPPPPHPASVRSDAAPHLLPRQMLCSHMHLACWGQVPQLAALKTSSLVWSCEPPSPSCICIKLLEL